MRKAFQRIREAMLMNAIKSGDTVNREIEKAFAEKLERNGWKRVEYRNFISYGKNGCYIDLLGFGFDIQSGIFSTNCFYEELDLSPVDSNGEPCADNYIFIGSARCDLTAPVIPEETYWEDADGPYTGEIRNED